MISDEDLKAMKVNINHKVTLVPQSTNDNCWLAAIAMLKGATTYTPQPYVDTRFFLSEHGGIPPQAEYYKRLARAYRLRYAELKPGAGATQTLPQFQKLLTIAPVGVFDTQLLLGNWTPHATVIGAMKGNGTPSATMLTEYNPLPVNKGTICLPKSYQTWVKQPRYLSSPQTILCLLY